MKDYYVCLESELVPVTREVWEVYYRCRSKERYQQEVTRRRMISSDDSSFMDYLINSSHKSSESAEECAIHNLLCEELLKLVEKLSDEDKTLIVGLFVHNLTERQLGEILNLAQQTVSYRKNKILKRFKKLLS